jgi:hypothetical protein
MIDLKNLGLQPGQELRLITTKNETVLGKFKKISSDGSKMEIVDIKLLDGSGLGKSRWYFKEDIKHIKVKKLQSASEQTLTEAQEKEEKLFNPVITTAQRDRIQKMIENAVYVRQANAAYHEAIKDISENLYIGLNAENTEFGR